MTASSGYSRVLAQSTRKLFIMVFHINPLTPDVTFMSQIFAFRIYRMLHKCYTRIRVGVHRTWQPVHSYLQHDLTVIVQYLDKRRVVHCLLRSWSIGGGPVAAAVLQTLVEVPLTDHTNITPPQGHYYGSQSEG